MRRNIHRLLTGFPGLAVAILALLAAANPPSALARLRWFAATMTDSRFFWLCVAIVLVYFALWWMTSAEPKTRRQKLQDGLRPLARQMRDFQSALMDAQDDAQFKLCTEALDVAIQPCAQWIRANLGEEAFTLFSRPNVNSLLWSWNTNPGSNLMDWRNTVLNLQVARVGVLELFLQSGAWDSPPPTLRQRIAKRLGG